MTKDNVSWSLLTPLATAALLLAVMATVIVWQDIQTVAQGYDNVTYLLTAGR